MTSIMVILICIPISNVEVFFFHENLLFLVLEKCNSDWDEMECQCLIWVSLMIKILNFFICLLIIVLILKSISQFICLLTHWAICVLGVKFVYILYINPLVRKVPGKGFFPFHSLYPYSPKTLRAPKTLTDRNTGKLLFNLASLASLAMQKL